MGEQAGTILHLSNFVCVSEGQKNKRMGMVIDLRAMQVYNHPRLHYWFIGLISFLRCISSVYS